MPRAIKESDKAARQLQNHAIRLTGLACRWIFPETFNAALNTGLNKSDILSQTSLQLAFDLRNQHPDSPAVIWCDRHGGRKRYAGVVSHCFDAARVEPLSETTHHSHYYIHDCEHPTSIHFSVGGESQLPVAVASMTAKYTRELAMDVFNKFWTDKLPSLQPTAGYPVDAQRWWKETEKIVGHEYQRRCPLEKILILLKNDQDFTLIRCTSFQRNSTLFVMPGPKNVALIKTIMIVA